jgi:hypothetical protein
MQPGKLRTLQIIGILVTLFCLATCTAAQTDLSSRLDAAMKRLAGEQAFSGAVLVAKNKKISLEEGYGLADKGRSLPVKRES